MTQTETRVYLDIAVSNSFIGRVEMELYTMDCPITCENFRALCTGERQRNRPSEHQTPLHFKGNCFHRVIKGFMMQAGRFLNDEKESIGESIYGGRFPDENFIHKHSEEGLLSMANSGPNTNSSQFFITFAPAPHLDGNFFAIIILQKLKSSSPLFFYTSSIQGKHVVFGRVVKGMETLKFVEQVPTSASYMPLQEVKIIDCGQLKDLSSSMSTSSSSSSSSLSSSIRLSTSPPSLHQGLNTSSSKEDDYLHAIIEVAFVSSGSIFTNNNLGLLKEALFAKDERLSFILRRYLKQSIDLQTASKHVDEFLANFSGNILNKIFKNCSLQKAKAISNEERGMLNTKEKSLTYGEIDFASFYKVLRDIPHWARKRGVFYDLGSGTGRAVIAARLLGDFSLCRGVEILEGLHVEAATVVNDYLESYAKLQYFGIPTGLEVFCDSFTTYDWSDGDVVFANSTCFSDDLMVSLSDQAEALKKDSIVITFTKALSSSQFEVVKKIRYKMSWGPATVYIHNKVIESEADSKTFTQTNSERWGRIFSKLDELERVADSRP